MFYFVKYLRIVNEAEVQVLYTSIALSMRVLREKMAFLVPVSVVNPN